MAPGRQPCTARACTLRVQLWLSLSTRSDVIVVAAGKAGRTGTRRGHARE